jgi:hypothetical protein
VPARRQVNIYSALLVLLPAVAYPSHRRQIADRQCR